MTEPEPRSLHLHTLDSLITDLVSGRPVRTGASKEFVLQDERTRSALDWYRRKAPLAWAANVTAQIGEDLVDAILLKPPELPALPAPQAHANSRRLRLKKMVAHRFAGLHKFEHPAPRPTTTSTSSPLHSRSSSEGMVPVRPLCSTQSSGF